MKKKLRRFLDRLSVRSRPTRNSHPSVPSVLIAYNEFGAYCIPRSSMHRVACQTVLAGQVWEPHTIAFMRANAGDGDVVHAGTYFGDFLPALSNALRGRAIIWAFEPSLENFRCAKTTTALNDLKNVELRHAALGPHGEIVRFVTTDQQGRSLGGWSHFDPERGNEFVEQIRLDDAVPSERNVSILQLDVEGYESQAIDGASQLIERNRPIVILESVPPYFAEKHRYVFDRNVDENSVFRPV